MAKQNVYITVAQATEMYGHPKAWWYNRIRSGEIPAYEVGGDKITKLRQSEVEDYIHKPARRKPIPVRRPIPVEEEDW